MIFTSMYNDCECNPINIGITKHSHLITMEKQYFILFLYRRTLVTLATMNNDRESDLINVYYLNNQYMNMLFERFNALVD